MRRKGYFSSPPNIFQVLMPLYLFSGLTKKVPMLTFGGSDIQQQNYNSFKLFLLTSCSSLLYTIKFRHKIIHNLFRSTPSHVVSAVFEAAVVNILSKNCDGSSSQNLDSGFWKQILDMIDAFKRYNKRRKVFNMLHDHWCPKIQFQISDLSLFQTGNVFYLICFKLLKKSPPTAPIIVTSVTSVSKVTT